MEVLEYGVKLADYMSPAAKSARESMDKLTTSLKTAKTDLASYQAQLAKAKTLGDIEGYRKYSKLVDGARIQTFVLSQELEKLPKVTATAGESFEALAGELGAIAGPAGIALGAITAVVAGFATFTVGAAYLAIQAGEARDELVTMFDALGEGPGAGEATISMLNDLEGPLGQTRERLADWTREFESIGITDLSGVQYQLQATGAAYAIMGEKGAGAYENLQAKIQEAIETGHGIKIADKGLAALGQTGANVADVAAKMGISAAELRNELKKGTADAQAFGDALAEAVIEKGQGPLDNLRTDLGTIAAHGTESFHRLFEGVDSEPFKVQLASLVGIMDEGNASADALHWGIKSFLDETFKLGTDALPVVKHFFLETIDEALVLYIALKPAIRAFNDLGGAAVWLEPIGFQFKVIAEMIKISVEGTAHFISLLAEIGRLNVQVASFGTLGNRAADGVAAGMRSGTEKVTKAGADLAGGAEDGARKKLDIHSPSHIGVRIGEYFGLGVAGGVRQVDRVVERASYGMGETMAEAPRMGFAPVVQAAPSRGAPSEYDSPYASRAADRAPISISVGGIHIQGHDQQSAMELTEVGVATLFERLAEQVAR